MKVLELFAGTGAISRAFRSRGHEAYTVDWNRDLELSLCADISKLTADDCIKLCGGRPDVIWASPDCTSYSVAAIGHHRKKDPATKELIAQTEYARFCDETNAHVVDLIMELNPTFWFIENPRGGMRTMSFVEGLPRYTVTYCKYGEERMKPTDIWTNHPDPKFIPPCRNGDPCHVSAPRGSRSGTQAIKGSLTRAAIPTKLCEHIVDICEEGMKMEGEVNENIRIRYLTPRECFRLMGQKDDAIDKLMAVEPSKTAQYKMAGNSIVVDVLEAIFKGIYIDETFDKPKPRQTSLEGWT